MEKNNALTIVIIIVLIAVGGYYAYQKWAPGLDNGTELLTEEISDPTGSAVVVAPSLEECTPSAIVVIDGNFQKTEDNLIYLAPEDDSESTEIIALGEETKFSEMKFSSELELIEEKEISLTDIKEGNNISVVVLCGENESDQSIAANVRLITISEGEGLEDVQ